MNKLLSRLIKKSKYLFTISDSTKMIAYHSITGTKAFLSPFAASILAQLQTPKTINTLLTDYELSKNKIRVKKIIESLISLGMLIYDDQIDQNLIIPQKSFTSFNDFSPRSLTLVLTDACNFNCLYCRQVSIDKPLKWKPHFMTQAIMRRGIKLFIENTPKDDRIKNLVFYGGEPLLHPNQMVQAAKYARQLEKKHSFGGQLQITIFTNGSRISHKLAKIFKEQNIYVIVSLDGPAIIHNLMRKNNNGCDTFSLVMSGINTLKELGCDIGLSGVIGSHNIDRLPEVIELYKQIKPRTVGLNLLHNNVGNPAYVPEMVAAEKLVTAHEICLKEGIYIEQVMRKVRSFVSQRIRIKDCAACGAGLVILPDGRIGPCEGVVGIDSFFTNSYNNISENSVFKEWFNRSPFNMNRCLDCIGLGICGGGCPLDAWYKFGSIWELDTKTCYLTKSIINWGFKKLWESCQISSSISIIDIYIPTKEDLKALLGNVEPYSNQIPLQVASFQFERDPMMKILDG